MFGEDKEDKLRKERSYCHSGGIDRTKKKD
jgi:hypothetical protein